MTTRPVTAAVLAVVDGLRTGDRFVLAPAEQVYVFDRMGYTWADATPYVVAFADGGRLVDISRRRWPSIRRVD